VLQQYPKSYLPEGLIGHLKFAMRHEPLDLGLLEQVFRSIDGHELQTWIREEPTGTFARRAWYLYELLTGKTVDVPDIIPAGYIDLLDPKLHITGPAHQVRRRRVNDNLLGDGSYCPLLRRTPALDAATAKHLSEGARALVQSCDAGILARAVQYLFTKETKSSFAIEGESPSPERTHRFVTTLMNAAAFDTGSKEAFVRLQQSIVEPDTPKPAGGNHRITFRRHGQTTAKTSASPVLNPKTCPA
jgi:hypothetical protein